jgi:ribosome-binding factor A
MSTRTDKIEEMIRREIAAALVRGELRDPRLGDATAISVTGVKVSPDLSSACVYVDVAGERRDIATVLKGLNAGAGVLHHALRERIDLRRTPSLRFEHDESIARGGAIERVLGELAAERAAANSATDLEATAVDDEEPTDPEGPGLVPDDFDDR